MSSNVVPQSPALAEIRSGFYESLALGYVWAGEQGAPLVMLHGWGAFKELWWSTLRDLGRDHRCFAIDLPGHGDSALQHIDSMAQIADMIAAFCAANGLEAITLFGHSMGGCVAVELALRHPDLVRRLVLVDAAVDARLMPAFARSYLLPGIGWPALRLMQTVGRGFRPLAGGCRTIIAAAGCDPGCGDRRICPASIHTACGCCCIASSIPMPASASASCACRPW